MFRDYDKIFAKNRETLKEWQKFDKEDLRKEFAQFFDSQEAVDKFMSGIEETIEYSTFNHNTLSTLGSSTPKKGEYSCENILDKDGAVNNEKLNEFLFHIYRTMKNVSRSRENEDFRVQYYDEKYSDASMEEARQHFEKAFPTTGKPGVTGISFMVAHFLGNENSRGIIAMLTPYIREVYKDNPKEGKALFDKLVQYELNLTQEERKRRRDARRLSNNMGKLFAGEESELGKGSNKKQMS